MSSDTKSGKMDNEQICWISLTVSFNQKKHCNQFETVFIQDSSPFYGQPVNFLCFYNQLWGGGGPLLANRQQNAGFCYLSVF